MSLEYIVTVSPLMLIKLLQENRNATLLVKHFPI